MTSDLTSGGLKKIIKNVFRPNDVNFVFHVTLNKQFLKALSINNQTVLLFKKYENSLKSLNLPSSFVYKHFAFLRLPDLMDGLRPNQ